MPIRFGTDGWRGIIADDFTFENVRLCAQGTADLLKHKGLDSRGLVVGYDTVWSYKGRPNWITTARSYELVDASSRSLVEVLAERRARLREQAADGA